MEEVREEQNTEFHCGCIVIGETFLEKYHEDKWVKWDELSTSLRYRIQEIQAGNSVIVNGDVIGVASNNQLSKISYKNIGGNIWIEDDAGSIKVDFGAMCDVMNSILMSAVCPIEIWYEHRIELLNCAVKYVSSTKSWFLNGVLDVYQPTRHKYDFLVIHFWDFDRMPWYFHEMTLPANGKLVAISSHVNNHRVSNPVVIGVKNNGALIYTKSLTYPVGSQTPSFNVDPPIQMYAGSMTAGWESVSNTNCEDGSIQLYIEW